MSEALIAAIGAGIGAVIAALGTLIVNTIKAKKEKTGDLELQYQHQERLVELTSGIRQDLNQTLEELKDCFDDMKQNLDNLEQKVDQFHSEQNQINLSMIRHDIVQVYEFYKEKEVMPLAVYESTMNLYDKYKAAGGNSFIDQVITEMREWERI